MLSQAIGGQGPIQLFLAALDALIKRGSIGMESCFDETK